MNEAPDTAQRPAQPVVATGPLFCASLEWHKGPALGGEGTAGKDKETGAPLWWNDDCLLIVVETNSGRELAIVNIDCDEDYWRVIEATTGEDYWDWGPECWAWWAYIRKALPPQNKADHPH